MTCLEHLIENGLRCVSNFSHDGFIDIMNRDVNYNHTKISAEDLWTICQYIKYGSSFTDVVRCSDCILGDKCTGKKSHDDYWCNMYAVYHQGDFFCADGIRKEN